MIPNIFLINARPGIPCVFNIIIFADRVSKQIMYLRFFCFRNNSTLKLAYMIVDRQQKQFYYSSISFFTICNTYYLLAISANVEFVRSCIDCSVSQSFMCDKENTHVCRGLELHLYRK